jgi:PAS domain-containing protein
MESMVMIVICSYCRKQIGEKEPCGDKRLSHGICSVCSDYYIPTLLKLNLSLFLDEQDIPIIMVDETGRIAGVNQAMLSFLGRSRKEVLGLLAGEMMGCRYSRLEQSCGKTVHCMNCTIRNTFNKCRETLTDQENVPAYLDRDKERIHFRVSAFHRKNFTKLIVDEIIGTEPLPASPEAG